MPKKAVIELSESELDLLNYVLEKGLDWVETALDKAAARKLITDIQKQSEKDRSLIEWEHPVVEGDRILNAPTDEGAEVLVRLHGGEYRIDEVCAEENVDGGFSYWLDNTQSWESVDAWAHLPEQKR